MAENSKIEWTDHTHNFWIGCTKVGPPCDNCYAEALSNRYGWVQWGPHGDRKRTSEANRRKPFAWAKAARKSGKRAKVFSLSLGDWLDNQVPQEWRTEMATTIEGTPELDWLLLSKRIQNYRRLAPWKKAPSNVWLGITCGNQAEYDRDWPLLRNIDATVRFISYEPALGPLSIRVQRDDANSDINRHIQPDWIICGGESGRNPRTMDPAWARALRDQCAEFGVSYFLKQMTDKQPIPDDLLIRQFPVPR